MVEVSDNYLFDISDKGDANRIKLLLDYLMPESQEPYRLVGLHRPSHWAVIKGDLEKGRKGAWEASKEPSGPRGDRLAFFWSTPKGEINDAAHPFIVKPSNLTLALMIDAWLTETEFPQQPDHDGSNSRGWRIYNETWGHVEGSFYGCFAVEPRWQMHGK